jgi:pyruvate kinase
MTKLFITLGPSTINKKFLSSISKKNIKLLRINLSHTNINDLPKIVSYIRKYSNIDICFDTEGAQIRTSQFKNNTRELIKNKKVFINKNNNKNNNITLLPKNIFKKIKTRDKLSIDFNSVVVEIVKEHKLYFECKVIQSGMIGSNKSVALNRSISIPPFTEKDLKAFEIAKDLNIKNIALSFTSDSMDIVKLRSFFKNKIKITSKIESKKGLKNLKNILKEADNILIDRGDLSKEIPLHLIPEKQKEIILLANKYKTPVYVATNLLESMVTSREPTRAEVNDVYNTLIDGANGLVLAAETAIGKYPLECIQMILKISKTI